MAPISTLFTRQAAAVPSTPTTPTTAPYPAAIALATLSLLVILLLLSPMSWHLRNRNVGATFLVAWTILINLQTLINALLWPHDDIALWYNGAGLCDVEVKVQIAFSVAAPAALAAVLRALANALDTSRATLVKSRAQRIRDYVVDLSFCLGFPALQMLFHYIDQPTRYLLFGIAGCEASVSKTWVTILLMDVPPLLWTLVDSYYAILILVRLVRYRSTMSSILTASNLSKTRFLRLYLFCIVLIITFVPLQAYTLSQNLSQARETYSWSALHDPAAVFPGLKPGYTSQRHSVSGTLGSLGSKARLVFKRGKSVSSEAWLSESEASASRAASTADPVSPKSVNALETIDELGTAGPSARGHAGHSTADPEKAAGARQSQTSLITRLTSIFTRKRSMAQDGIALFSVSGAHGAVHSDVSASRARASTEGQERTGGIEVIVRKEVRQSSETAETMGTVMPLQTV
ncbi:a-factor receptor [Friedmanniomyces endolithicus]|uniref:A-factor receptor n=1 Tax=Rachicladosporium monterosium TaxID=1507873 RepID=A0ABR0LC50_9PEZI|nr:a-factor receptor [Friedmanniomyces endolithicus]KAK5146646.1 a-factor receptor [Rachicladosporium monterosium]